MLEINEPSRRVAWNGTPVPLTLTEVNVIRYLATAPGEFYSCRKIYDVIKGIPGFCAGDGLRGVHSNVRSMIKRIRKKFLAIDPGFEAITCYTAFGYGWNAKYSIHIIAGEPDMPNPAKRRPGDATYDPKAGAAYIYLDDAPKGSVCRTQMVIHGVYFDYDKDGRIIGIELLNPKLHLSKALAATCKVYGYSPE